MHSQAVQQSKRNKIKREILTYDWISLSFYQGVTFAVCTEYRWRLKALQMFQCHEFMTVYLKASISYQQF